MDEIAASFGKAPGKLEVLEVAGIFAEAIRRVHHGESISALFQYD
jgi:ribose-phosphate pyrophosphokinase